MSRYTALLVVLILLVGMPLGAFFVARRVKENEEDNGAAVRP